ncbi:hypothetical protein CBS147482_602 [Aspergillus niger]|nr:hypothetical protein CBS147482_602 [Aspergillus niger]
MQAYVSIFGEMHELIGGSARIHSPSVSKEERRKQAADPTISPVTLVTLTTFKTHVLDWLALFFFYFVSLSVASLALYLSPCLSFPSLSDSFPSAFSAIES